MDYRDYLLKIAPSRFKRPFGQAWLHIKGLLADAFVEATRQAIKAKDPLSAPGDALQWIASERGLEKYSVETEESWRNRLASAWSAWAQSGTRQAIEGALQLAGVVAPYVFEVVDWSSIDEPNDWNRFWVIIPQPHTWLSDGLWQDGGLWDETANASWNSSATIDEISFLFRVVNTFRPAHAKLVAIIAIVVGEIWDYPTGTWDDDPSALWQFSEAVVWQQPNLRSNHDCSNTRRPQYF